jgi:hypothetical protein
MTTTLLPSTIFEDIGRRALLFIVINLGARAMLSTIPFSTEGIFAKMANFVILIAPAADKLPNTDNNPVGLSLYLVFAALFGLFWVFIYYTRKGLAASGRSVRIREVKKLVFMIAGSAMFMAVMGFMFTQLDPKHSTRGRLQMIGALINNGPLLQALLLASISFCFYLFCIILFFSSRQLYFRTRNPL